MWTAFLDRFPVWSDLTVLFGLNILFQSTLIILIGLAGMHILRMRRAGAAAQSLLLRICLSGVLLAPAALLVSSSAGIKGFRLETPLHGIHSVSAPSATAPRTPSAVSLPSNRGERFSQRENSASTQKMRSSSQAAPLLASTRLPATPDLSRNNTPGNVTRLAPASPPMAPDESRASSRGITHKLPALFLLAWVFLALFFTLRAVAITLYIRRIRSLSFPLLPHHADLGKSAADELGIPMPLILQSPYVSSALLTGVFRPIILIPFGGEENLMATREIFLHEFAHKARRDPLWLHLCQMAKILFPFQPLLWTLARHIEELSDYACDDYVIQHTGGNKTYAAMLLNLARTSQLRVIEASAGSGILSSRFPLVRRIQRILDNSYSRHISVSANEAMSFTIIFLCAVTLSGFIGFRGKSFAQESKFSETLSRGGRTAALTLFPMVEKQIGVVLKHAGGLSATVEAALREKSAPMDENPVSENESAASPTGNNTVFTEASSAPASTLSMLSGVENVSGLLTATEPDPAPASANYDVENSPVEQNTGKRSSVSPNTPFLPPSLTETRVVYLPEAATDNTDIQVPAGEFQTPAKEQETYSGLKSNLDWGKRSPVWSPDGKTIAFTEDTGFGIWIAPSGGGEPRLVYDNRGEWEYEGRKFGGGNMRTLCFTPDGKNITFVNYVFDRTRGSRRISTAGKSLSWASFR